MLGLGGKSYHFALGRTAVSLVQSRTASRSAENFPCGGGPQARLDEGLIYLDPHRL
jgi:hypothetical protein